MPHQVKHRAGCIGRRKRVGRTSQRLAIESQGLVQLAFAHELLALAYELGLLLLLLAAGCLSRGWSRLRAKSGCEDQDHQGTMLYAVHGQPLSHSAWESQAKATHRSPKQYGSRLEGQTGAGATMER